MNDKIVIIGYSGHSFGCIEALKSKKLNIYGYCDKLQKNTNPFNLNFIGIEENINFDCSAFISIGNNELRKNVYYKKYNSNINFNWNIIHSSANISKNVSLGSQIYISMGVIINSLVTINTGSIINSGAIIEHECKIGSFSHIAPGAILCGNVTIGDNCLIGANSVILPSLKIGDNVTVGAGSVVLKDIESNSIYAGKPAKLISKK